MYGQTLAPVDTPGRAILMLSAGIAAAINVTARMPQLRLVRSTHPKVKRVHNLLLCCATSQLVIHVARAFLAIYTRSNATAEQDWIDFLLVPLQTTMFLLVATYWPMLKPTTQGRASTIGRASGESGDLRERVDPGRTRSSQSGNPPPSGRSPTDKGKVCGDPQNPVPGADQGNAKAEQPGDQRHAGEFPGRARTQTVLHGLLVAATLVAAMTAMSTPAMEHPTPMCHDAPVTELDNSQQHVLPATAASRASALQLGFAQSEVTATQKVRLKPPAASGRRRGASRAPRRRTDPFPKP